MDAFSKTRKFMQHVTETHFHSRIEYSFKIHPQLKTFCIFVHTHIRISQNIVHISQVDHSGSWKMNTTDESVIGFMR